VLSGDSEGAVEATLQGLAVDFVRAQVRPEEKAAAIAALREQRPGGTIAFVGDGINDAPALAAADLGIAMAGGTDIARSSGDVLLTGNRLAAIPETLELARRTIRIIRQNLFWAFAYNVAAIPLAMAGVLSPGIAAGAMILSSLTVVGNALRLRR
jgi:Cu+-exporting ATPase